MGGSIMCIYSKSNLKLKTLTKTGTTHVIVKL